MKKILILFSALLVTVVACKKEESPVESTTPTQKTTVDKKNKSFCIDFSETWCPPCGAYGGPTFDECLKIEGSTITCMKVYGSSTPSSLNSSLAAGISNAYNVTGIPDFYVNGVELYPGGGVGDPADNMNIINTKASAFAAETVVGGVVMYNKSISGTTLKVTTKVKFFEAQPANNDYRLAVYVVETDLTADQQVAGQGLVSGYKHHNLLRTANATDYKGVKINNNAAITANQEFVKDFTITLQSSWKTANLKLIGVVYKVNGSGLPTVINTELLK